MGWLGSLAGMYVGSSVGGLLGGIIGAILGGKLEEKIRGSQPVGNAYRSAAQDRRELVTLTALAAMLAKLAKADGIVTRDEVEFCERVFTRLGFTGEKREYCIQAFRRAKGGRHTIYEYAADFAASQPDATIRELVYDILWDLAFADGVLHPDELSILRRIIVPLNIRAEYYAYQARMHGVGSRRRAESPRPAEPADAYSILGVPPDADDATVRRAYREKAKRLHPDVLRQNGLSEEMLERANAQMARLNAAWAEIKRARGL